MACYHPQKVYWANEPNASGKHNIQWTAPQTPGPKGDRPFDIPCGYCIGCRLEKSRNWAVRCLHEANQHPDNCFLTLTYNDEHLPRGGSLHLPDFQNFMKRLRQRNRQKLIRFFHCGEYGEKNGRPHYHAIVFNHDFDDKTLWRKAEHGDNLYRSKTLEELWPFGNAEIGDVTFKSAAYVARYILKKRYGKNAHLYYEKIDPLTGEVHELRPEYVTMSRRPGVGKSWFDKYKNDAFPDDFVIINGKKCRPPKYYERLLEKEFPEEFKDLKGLRETKIKNIYEYSPERLAVKEEIQFRRVEKLKRSYENG